MPRRIQFVLVIQRQTTLREKSKLMEIKKEYKFLDLSRVLPWIFIILFLGLCFLVFWIYQPFLLSFFIALLLYVLLRQPHEWLRKSLNKNDTIAATISTFLIMALIIIPVAFILVSLIQEASIAYEKLSAFLTQEKISLWYESNPWVKEWFDIDISSITNSYSKLQGYISEQRSAIIEQGGNALILLSSFITKFIFAIFILFFLFRSGHKLGPIIYKTLPFPDEVEQEVGDRMVNVLDAVIKGNVVISLLQGIMIGVYFWFFGLPTPILYGSLATIFALLPIIGTAIIWAPGATYLYLSGSPTSAVFFGILSLASYLILENLLKPWILDKRLNLHPAFLFLALLGGLSAFGVKGLILGPFIVTTFLSFWELITVWNEKYGNLNRNN